MSRRKRQPPKLYQRRSNGSSHFNQLYDDLLDSKAYHSLSARQKVLYIYCVRETYGAAMRDSRTDDGSLFYMNKALRTKVHELYPNSDTHCFEEDMSALISVGLVDFVKSGHEHRHKNKYRLSARWNYFGTCAFSLPDDVKSTFMHTQERKQRRKEYLEQHPEEKTDASSVEQ